MPREYSPERGDGTKHFVRHQRRIRNGPFDDNVIINYTRESLFSPDEIAKPQFVWLACITNETGSKNQGDFVEPRITRRSFFSPPALLSCRGHLTSSFALVFHAERPLFQECLQPATNPIPRFADECNSSVRPLR